MKETGEHFWRATLFSLFGPLLWTAHFGLVYGGQHVGCATPVSLDPAWVIGGIVAATFAAAAPLLVGAVWPHRLARLFGLTETDNSGVYPFLVGATRLLSLLSLFGVLWAGAAAAFLPSCPALR